MKLFMRNAIFNTTKHVGWKGGHREKEKNTGALDFMCGTYKNGVKFDKIFLSL